MNIVLENSKNEAHIKCALDILNECYERYNPNEVFISFNGGKDCTVVLHLAATIAKLRNISSLLCLYIIEDSFPERKRGSKEKGKRKELRGRWGRKEEGRRNLNLKRI
ncbi:FAD synthase-like [Temnothorax curvispinosus]|uniref:FAD synthase-like n=1 Tax=Temnothorax curvispinosus TaxID=300111 RepID=A0A6J1Q2X6_9HYME|nr:FAD synthase-like [Temnothorax curvispinosus]